MFGPPHEVRIDFLLFQASVYKRRDNVHYNLLTTTTSTSLELMRMDQDTHNIDLLYVLS